MRILLAIDGSPSATTACELVASTEWPERTTIRVLAVAVPAEDLLDSYLAPAGVAFGAAADDAQHLHSAVDEAVARLTGEGRVVESSLVRGRPASEIVSEAGEFGADLIVLGSHGHGTLERLLLGSVSTEVVDHAPCPVLVARKGRVRSILLAVDGSHGAAQATGFVIQSGAFATVPVTAFSVFPVGLPGSVGVPTAYLETSSLYAEALDLTRRRYREMATETAGQLRAAGRSATPLSADGDPAAVILDAARAHDIDLIVVGTHGRTGLMRLLLGSVARKVLLHAEASVLVVPDRARAGQSGPDREAWPVGSSAGSGNGER
jgi:nucleotide-binding universal stress UspA family protein